jgi:hypothetical protein
MFSADVCLRIPSPCLREVGGLVSAVLVPLAVRAPSSYRGCRGVAVICRRKSLSSAKSTEDGGRGSELLLLRPACHVLSSAGICCGCGDGVGRTFCDEGLRILIEELRTLFMADRDGLAAAAGGCGAGVGEGARVCEVVVTVGLVWVVDWVPKWNTEVPLSGVVECVVVVPWGPFAVVVVVVVVEVVDDCG